MCVSYKTTTLLKNAVVWRACTFFVYIILWSTNMYLLAFFCLAIVVSTPDWNVGLFNMFLPSCSVYDYTAVFFKVVFMWIIFIMSICLCSGFWCIECHSIKLKLQQDQFSAAQSQYNVSSLFHWLLLTGSHYLTSLCKVLLPSCGRSSRSNMI